MPDFTNCPPEVAEYYQNGVRRAVYVQTVYPYVIIAEFDNGICKRYDMEHCLDGVLSCLRDYELFKQVYIDEDGCIAWDVPPEVSRIGHIDMSKDTVYIYGEEVR